VPAPALILTFAPDRMILSGPEAPRHRFIDQCHFWRSEVVGLGDIAVLQDRHVEKDWEHVE
jgi:hypothetical protein